MIDLWQIFWLKFKVWQLLAKLYFLYITVPDLTTILLVLLIATIVLNLSELCLKWGGSVGWERAAAVSEGFSSQKPWSRSSTVAHKHFPVFSFLRGKAVFTRLSSSLADTASGRKTFTLSKYIYIFLEMYFFIWIWRTADLHCSPEMVRKTHFISFR